MVVPTSLDRALRAISRFAFLAVVRRDILVVSARNQHAKTGSSCGPRLDIIIGENPSQSKADGCRDVEAIERPAIWRGRARRDLPLGVLEKSGRAFLGLERGCGGEPVQRLNQPSSLRGRDAPTRVSPLYLHEPF